MGGRRTFYRGGRGYVAPEPGKTHEGGSGSSPTHAARVAASLEAEGKTEEAEEITKAITEPYYPSREAVITPVRAISEPSPDAYKVRGVTVTPEKYYAAREAAIQRAAVVVTPPLKTPVTKVPKYYETLYKKKPTAKEIEEYQKLMRGVKVITGKPLVRKAKLQYYRFMEYAKEPTPYREKIIKGITAIRPPIYFGLARKFDKGFYREVIAEPFIPETKGGVMLMGAIAGVSFGLPFAARGVGVAAAKTGITKIPALVSKVPILKKAIVTPAKKVLPLLKTAAGLALAGIYITPKLEEAKKAPTVYKKMAVFTRAGFREVAPAILGYQLQPIVTGFFKTVGKKYISREKIATVTEGIAIAPRKLTAAEIKRSFVEKRLIPPPAKGIVVTRYAGLPGEPRRYPGNIIAEWHVAPTGIKKGVTPIVAGKFRPGEIKGIYGSPVAQAYFARLPGYDIGLGFPKYVSPEIARIRARGITSDIKEALKYGYLYAPLKKKEYEAIGLAAGKLYLVTTKPTQYFTKIGAVRVPLTEKALLPLGQAKGFGIPSGEYVVSSEYVSYGVTPYQLAPSMIKLPKPSYVQPSYKSIFYAAPTYRPTPTPYVPPYKPGIPSVSLVPYKPSKRPSYFVPPPAYIPPPTPPYVTPYVPTPPPYAPPYRPPKVPKYVPPTAELFQYFKTPPPPPQPLGKPSIKQVLKKVEKRILGFQTFVKRAGTFKLLPGIIPKQLAIRKGEKIVRETLAATFMIRPTKTFVKGIEKAYDPGLQFRTYKIKKGKKIPLEFEWIQKRKYRLGTRAEVREIQRARKVRSGDLFSSGGWF